MSEPELEHVLEAVLAGCTTKRLILSRLRNTYKFHPALDRFVEKSLHRLRRQRLIINCNQKKHGKTGWHVRPLDT